MNIQRKNPTHHFRMQSEREQTLVKIYFSTCVTSNYVIFLVFIMEVHLFT